VDPDAGLRVSARRPCPSCQARLGPLALECPVCGLRLERPPLPRPLLFQASVFSHRGDPPVRTLAPRPTAITAPALGRVAPVAVADPPATLDSSERLLPEAPPEALEEGDGASSFWVLARLEFGEALCVLTLNALLWGVVALSAGAPAGRVYGELWHLMVLLHLAVSWAFFMIPLTLTGQTPLMGSQELLLDADLPERRLSFSLFHLLSVLLFPVSFLCMVLTPGHRTLAELLTGQEILMRTASRMR
jgi:hypothetical protein